MNWLDRVKNPVHFTSEAGSPYKTIYAPVVNKDGTIDLKEKEKECLYDYIQSFKDSCDINVLVKRYQMGDTAALMRGQTFFGDVTEMPKTFAEMLNVMVQGQNFFENLPAEVKEKFGNSFYQFAAAIDIESPEALELLGLKKMESAPEAAPEAVSSEVKSNE